jgi:IPT/TIG domain
MFQGRIPRLLTAIASVSLLGGGLTLAAVAGTATGAAAAAPDAASCTFNGVAGGGVVTGVTPGGSISMACTGLPDNASVSFLESSPLAGIVVPSDDDADLVDLATLSTVTTTATGTLPAGTAFSVPTTFKASDKNGVCGPTQAQINAGLIGCQLVVVDVATETSYANVALSYAADPAPQNPSSVTLGSGSAEPGQAVTLSNGSGSGGWWGNGYDKTSLTASDIKVGSIDSPSTDATISAASYAEKTKTLSAPAISGSFTVPCGVGGAQTVTVTEPNESGLSGTISTTASLDVLPGTTPEVTGISPATGPSSGGTSVAVSGCSFSHITAVDFGSKPATSYTVNSTTSITAVAPAGTGTVDVTVHGTGGISSTSALTEFSYGVQGYDLAGSDGGTFSFGEALNYGSLPGLKVIPNKPVVGIAATNNAEGYWLAGADGGIYSFGNAKYQGSLPGLGVTPAAPVVGIAETPDSGGYWLVGADGGVYAFGDAKYYGSLPGLGVAPSGAVVGIVATSTGDGYWLVSANGGVYAFGDAKYYGSLPGLGVMPAKAISGIAATADGAGYWLVGQDGGVYAFGDAHFDGSLPSLPVAPSAPVIGIVSPDSGGYWLIGSNGGVYSFGDAKFFGSLGDVTLQAPVVGGSV